MTNTNTMGTDDFKKFRNQIFAALFSGLVLIGIGGAFAISKTAAQLEVKVETNTVKIKENSTKIDQVKDRAFEKSDFIEFKKELFNRLDRTDNLIEKIR